ncbi:hypothetical protein Taro_011207 [Colocasia esculenta]|uniref:RING-type E3 ubiquitin transferase n=1 Tax=Colocasia esculenta TaxID=4460 RepID=A0A843U9K4_COLES|nr:hypothetical protein [Colocasia esculenta]
MAGDLPCDPDGVCMVCKTKPLLEECIPCSTCVTPWHPPCLSRPPESLASIASWECPDCAAPASGTPGKAPAAGAESGLVAAIRAIEADAGMTERQKARKRQELLSGGAPELSGDDEGDDMKRGKRAETDVLDLLGEKFKCSICMQLPERPVTTPCGHNFCLKCFQRWTGQGKYTCAKCRSRIPQAMVSHPRINSALVIAIRTAKTSKMSASDPQAPVLHYVRNEDKPDEAYRTERAKKAGKANACSGQIFVTIPPDHFGPITREYDPKYGEGVYVGRTWDDRMECRQWGAHFPHVAGIAGQSDYGAQSVALSGGYEDDEDHGEWFLYTGSGGRDLSGNKRTNKEQSFDQKFEKLNQALRVSCLKGYPVRVVRSHKEKRSSYAPEKGVRYDGVYRIEMCWRKVGIQGYKVCRYLFVRCDNDPAPWTSDTYGDRPRPLPKIPELKKATDVTKREESPAWDYDEQDGWKWIRPPPPSRKMLVSPDPAVRKQVKRAMKHSQNSVREMLLKEFCCLICKNVMKLPLTTPCAHNFCKFCLLGSFDDLSAVKERTRGGRTLRAQKIVRKCPCCPNDISDFLQNPQVNREMMDLIESLQRKDEEECADRLREEGNEEAEKSGAEESDNNDGKLSGEGSDHVEKSNPTDEGIIDMDSLTNKESNAGMKMSNGEDGMEDKSADQNGNLAENSNANTFGDSNESTFESVEAVSDTLVYKEGFVGKNRTPEKDFTPCKRKIDDETVLTGGKKAKAASLTRSQKSLVE